MKHTRLLIPLIVLLLASLACSIQLTDTPAAQLAPAESEVQVVTEPPTIAEPSPEAVSTEPLPQPTTAAPTEAAAESTSPCPPYASESFSDFSPCWDPAQLFSVTRIDKPRELTIETAFDMLIFNLRDKQELYLYLFNEHNQYEDVIVEAEIVNLKPGVNKNGAILACRVNDTGWYEVRIESGGYFHAYQYDRELAAAEKNPYIFLGEAGTNKIKSGYDTPNKVAFHCVGHNLKLYINDALVWEKEIESNGAGGIAIGVNSYASYYPLVLGFDQLNILAP